MDMKLFNRRRVYHSRSLAYTRVTGDVTVMVDVRAVAIKTPTTACAAGAADPHSG